MAREWYNRPVNSGYTYVDGVTTGNYNNGVPNTYVKTWMEYLVIQNDTDKANNRSRIDVKLYSQVIDGGSSTGMSSATTANNYGYVGFDNANQQYLNTTYDFNGFALNKFADATLTIPHNADGTKSITLQGVFQTLSGTWAITGGSVSANITLPAINVYKPTTISSVGVCNYGFPTTIELSRKASNLRELVTLSNGSKTFTLKTTSSDATVFQYTLPYKDGNDILVPNTTKPSPSTWTLYVTTYNGGSQVGDTVSQLLTFTLRDDDTSLAPTLTAQPTVQAYNDVVSALGTDTAVAGYSKVNVIAQKASVSLKMGATISSRVVTFANGSSASADQNNHISTVVYQSGDFGWTYTVTDSRGYTVQRSGTYPVLPYSAPEVKDISVYRGNSSGTQTDSGTYIFAQATVSIASITHNTFTLKGAVGYGGTEVAMTSGVRATLKTDASTNNTYTVYITAQDLFSYTTITREVRAEDIPLLIPTNGHGIGFGVTWASSNDTAKFGYRIRAEKGFERLKIQDRLFGSANMLDRKRVLQGAYSDAMALAINPYMLCTPVMKVKPSTTYSIFVNSLSTYRVFFYVIKYWQWNKTFIQNEYTGNEYHYTFTTPSNCEYISIHMRHMDNGALVPSDVLELGMSEGSDEMGVMDDYVMSGTEVTDKLREMDLSNYTLRNRTFATCNLLDSALIEQGDWDGSNPTIRCHIKVKVKASTTYTQSVSGCVIAGVVYLNSSGSLISFENSGATTFTFTTPSGCAYAVPVFKKSDDSAISVSDIFNCQLEEGTTKTDYMPYTMDGVEVADRFNNIDNGYCRFEKFDGTKKIKITHQPSTYFCIKVFGFLANFGEVDMTLKCNNGNFTVTNNGASWSDSRLIISLSGDVLSMTVQAESMLMVMGA